VYKSRTHVAKLAFEIGVRSFGGLCFEAEGEGGGFDPAAQGVNALSDWGLGLGNARPSG
jgi:hypothetical protein